MSIFKMPTPTPLRGTDPGSRQAEETVRALAEAKQVVENLVNYFKKFSEWQITDGNGNVWNLLAQPYGGGAVLNDQPFTVITQTTDSGAIEWGVINDSPIYSDWGPSDFWEYLPPDGTTGGLLAPNPPTDDEAWITMAPVPSTPTTDSPYDCIYLQVSYNSDGSVNTTGSGALGTGIYSWGTGTRLFDPTLPAWQTGAWLENDGAVPPNFLVFRKPIAYATGSTQIIQKITQSQVIVPFIQQGLGGWYALATDTGYDFS